MSALLEEERLSIVVEAAVNVVKGLSALRLRFLDIELGGAQSSISNEATVATEESEESPSEFSSIVCGEFDSRIVASAVKAVSEAANERVWRCEGRLLGDTEIVALDVSLAIREVRIALDVYHDLDRLSTKRTKFPKRGGEAWSPKRLGLSPGYSRIFLEPQFSPSSSISFHTAQLAWTSAEPAYLSNST